MSVVDLMACDFDDFLMHYGVGWDDNPPGIGSGRYPKGSGENPNQHPKGLSGFVKNLRDQGMTESEVAKYLGYKSTTELRAKMMADTNSRKRTMSDLAIKYHDQGMSNTAIAEKLGVSEGTIRNYLDPELSNRFGKTTNVANMLKDEVDQKRYIDVGAGVEIECGISKERMKTAVGMLQEEGYKLYYVDVEQLGTGHKTTMKVLGAPDTEWKDVAKDPTNIKTITSYAQNDGETVLGLKKPVSIDSSRVYIRYAEESGQLKEGTIEIRPGVEDVSLGNSLYSQVRIGVDDKMYMKGMAFYSDTIPDGYDLVYNTKKSNTTAPEDVYKSMKTGEDGSVDWDNPFGATIKAGGQSTYTDANGNEQLRVINKVNDEGDWGEWSKQISAQVLSKQSVPVAKRQLDLTLKDKQEEFDEIMSLTNPTIKKQMLESYADDLDAAASHLKAKAFPGQAAHVIIPVNSMGDDKIYAPNYEDGITVAAIRYPFAGSFEMPVLKVDNKNAEARKILGDHPPDAVGITANVAARMSGADFDGDTVIIIPLTSTKLRTGSPLEKLKGFDTDTYKHTDPDAPGITNKKKQNEMGRITNLIADMQIKGVSSNDATGADELARAVMYSMVTIDSEKHHLDLAKAKSDLRIDELYLKYQGKPGGGASTLITKAGSEARVPETKLGSIVDESGKKHYGVDPATGKKILVETGSTYMKKSPTKKDENRYVETTRLEKTTKMAVVDDAYDLMSSKTNPHPMEKVYADYANSRKSMANEARKQAVNTPKLKRDPVAAKEYAAEVESLNRKLTIAEKNAPRERQAHILAKAIVKQKVEANPSIKSDDDAYRRLRGQALTGARLRVGAKKERIDIGDREWEAIQRGAISDSKLQRILRNTDADALKQRATPRNNESLSTSKTALAKAMAANGYTQAEIAERIGVSASTVSKLIA